MTVFADQQTEPIPISGGRAEQAAIEETFIINSRRYTLDVDRRPLDFRLDPVPAWIYQVEGIEIEKRVITWPGERSAVIEYELFGVDHDPLPACALEVRTGLNSVRRFDLSRCTRATVILSDDSD